MENETQVLYLGRWVSKEHFRVFVYNKSSQRLVNSYNEFSELIASGIWFANKPVENDLKKEDLPDLDTNIIDIKPKRGKKCQNQRKA